MSDVAKIGREADCGSPETVRSLQKLDVQKTLQNLSYFDDVDVFEVPKDVKFKSKPLFL